MNAIKNKATEIECQRIATLAVTDKEAAGTAFVELVNKPSGPAKFWEVQAIKERIQFLMIEKGINF